MEHTEVRRAGQLFRRRRWRSSNPPPQRRDGAGTKDKAVSFVLQQGAERVLKGCQQALSQEIGPR